MNYLNLKLTSAMLITITLLICNGLMAQTPKVAGGTIIGECGFGPQVVSTEGVCTATLIHPEVVLFAGHCTTWPDLKLEFTHLNNDIIWDESFGISEPTGVHVEAKECRHWKTEPSAEDIAFCVLKEPVYDIPIIPVAWGCELDEYLNVGQDVTIIGFGDNGGAYQYDKRVASTTIQETEGYWGIVTAPNNGQHTCPGDSGGPLLVQMDDGSWRTLGNLSSINGDCGSPDSSNNYPSVVDSVPWIEEQLKQMNYDIDITPCFDSDGTWNPTEECGGFYSGDKNASTYGTWDNWCQGTPRTGYSSTCGAPYGDDGSNPWEDTDTPENEDTDEDSENTSIGDSTDENQYDKDSDGNLIDSDGNFIDTDGNIIDLDEDSADTNTSSGCDCAITTTQNSTFSIIELLLVLFK